MKFFIKILISSILMSTFILSECIQVDCENGQGTKIFSDDTATNPEKPIKKTIGIITKKEKIKLFFKTSVFFAA